jgi:hypothetical protein
MLYLELISHVPIQTITNTFLSPLFSFRLTPIEVKRLWFADVLLLGCPKAMGDAVA